MDNPSPGLENRDFARLYDAYAKKIYDYVYYRTHHRETAEDMTSAVFMKALEKFSSFDPAKGSFSAWIYRIAHNTVIDHYRTSRPNADIEDIWDALADNTNILRDTDAKNRLADISAYLQALPASQRDIIVMRVWDGLSYAEIAEMIGKSEAACKMSFSRAIGALRAHFGPMAALAFFSILQ